MIRRNIYANILGRVWGFISVYIFIPVYLRFLGIEAYGLVGFYSTLLGILAFADLGFTATLSREMARLSVKNDAGKDMRELLRTYELTYMLISLIQSLLLWILAPEIAVKWLRSNTLPSGELIAALRIMGIGIAFQLPSGLYIGGLMGLQRQVQANLLQVSWGIFRGVGAVLVLWLYSPTIIAFFVWQVVANAIYCFLARRDLWSSIIAIPPKSPPRFNKRVYRTTWHYAAGMLGMTVISTLIKQADKLAVSKMLSLDLLGYYSLASAMAMAPLALASPIGLAVFPQLTGFVEKGDRVGLVRLYHRTCEIIAGAIIPGAVTLAFFSRDFIYAWTGSEKIAERTGVVAALLVCGQLSQALTVVPYYLTLAHGNVRLLLAVNLSGLILFVPLLYGLIRRYGLMGGGVAWLAMNLITVMPYMYLIHHRFLPGQGMIWFLSGVVRPLAATIPCVAAGHWLLPWLSSRILTFGKIGLVFASASAATVVSSSELRLESRRFLKTIPLILNKLQQRKTAIGG